MIKYLLLILILCFSGIASCGENITNIMGAPCPEIVGGSNVVTLHPHYVDHWFSVYNNGHVTYQIYAYNYIGIHDPPYLAAFIGAIEPGQMGVLNNNASYKIYATSPPLSEITVEKIEKRFNQYWFIGILIIIILIVIIKIWRELKR